MKDAPLTGETIEDAQIASMLAEEQAGRQRAFALEVLEAALLPEGAALRVSRRAARDLAARTWNARQKATKCQ